MRLQEESEAWSPADWCRIAGVGVGEREGGMRKGRSVLRLPFGCSHQMYANVTCLLPLSARTTWAEYRYSHSQIFGKMRLYRILEAQQVEDETRRARAKLS